MVAGALGEGIAPSRADAVRAWFARARADQEGRLFYWAPILLTFGIWGYFALETEPSTLVVIGVPGVALVCFWLGRTRPLMLVIAILLAGFVLAKLRADWVATPVLRATSPEVAVTGTVVRADFATASRLTVILVPDAIEGLAPGEAPRKLRLSLRAKLGHPQPGERVAFKARLLALPGPVEPGGFDFGRKLWFEGIGGTGRITSEVKVLGDAAGLSHRFERAMAALRQAIGQRIRAHLDGTTASFAEALITGERAAIPDQINQSLMASGLFHVLSISGLHMWLVAGGVFWMVRAALALWPAAVLRYPVKKWSAAAALLMGFFYMLLADSGVATERSFIMIAVVFFAVMVDRPALSTRNLAIAAIIVLLIHPEAAIDASFQMSFLAVLGLVAFYEWWSARERDETLFTARPWWQRLARKTFTAIFLALATTAIAGSMSSIPAAYHFGRLAPYGLIANGLAFPVIGIIVMPMALVSAILMPLGLEALPLWIMGEGLKLVMAISDWVASLPDARMIVARPPQALAIAMAFGGAYFCLVNGTLRWLGPLVMIAALAFGAFGGPHPDILIDRTGGNVAFRNEDGELVPALSRRGRFAVERWLQANGEEATLSEAAKRPGWTCSATRCDASLDGQRIAFISGDETQAIDCAGLSILIADFPLRGRCREAPTRIDRFDLWRNGAHALYLENGTEIVTARQNQGDRPWSQAPLARKDVWRLPQPSTPE